MSRISVSWKNGSVVISRQNGKTLLDDLRQALPEHPLGTKIYWRDDVFDPLVFHGHHVVKHPFDALGESIATAYIVKE